MQRPGLLRDESKLDQRSWIFKKLWFSPLAFSGKNNIIKLAVDM